MKLTRPVADAVQEKFATVRRDLSSALIERDEEVDLVLTALVANEHVLFVGPPGCAKSLLLDSVLGRMRPPTSRELGRGGSPVPRASRLAYLQAAGAGPWPTRQWCPVPAM